MDKNTMGTWAKDSNGKWVYTKAKKAVVKKQVKTTIRLRDILDKEDTEDAYSAPDLLKESGGHIDRESGEWVENDY